MSEAATAGRAGDAVLDVLVVSVNGHRAAFHLTDVHEILPAAELAPLPHAPVVVRGLLNLRGEPLPVLDLRVRLGLPGRPVHPDDHVVVCRVGDRKVGVWVDRADDVRRLDSTELSAPDHETRARHLAGVALVEDGILLVADVDSFLSVEESAALKQALVDAVQAGAHA